MKFSSAINLATMMVYCFVLEKLFKSTKSFRTISSKIFIMLYFSGDVGGEGRECKIWRWFEKKNEDETIMRQCIRLK